MARIMAKSTLKKTAFKPIQDAASERKGEQFTFIYLICYDNTSTFIYLFIRNYNYIPQIIKIDWKYQSFGWKNVGKMAKKQKLAKTTNQNQQQQQWIYSYFGLN